MLFRSSNITGTVAIGNGGSGQTTAQAAMNAFAGAVTSGSYLRGNGTNVVMSTIQAADVPTLNQNTTGTAANITAYTINQSVGSSNSPTFAGLTVPSITHSGTSGSGDIGASGAAFGTVWAKATSAQYADLAENYTGDQAYNPGVVLEFGGEAEVTISTTDMSQRVAGVVSTNPAFLMNDTLSQQNTVTVAFQGRVPCNVQGTVRKGDMMVSAGKIGRAHV